MKKERQNLNKVCPSPEHLIWKVIFQGVRFNNPASFPQTQVITEREKERERDTIFCLSTSLSYVSLTVVAREVGGKTDRQKEKRR